MRPTGRVSPLPTLLMLAAGWAVAQPEFGTYEARLCVSTPQAAPNCGPAEVELQADGVARVRIDDVTYRLEPKGALVDVVLMHNATQIDAFTTPYDWQEGALSFADAAKQLRFEVRLGKLLSKRLR